MRLNSMLLEKTNRKNESFPFFIYKLDCEKNKTAIVHHWHEELEIIYALDKGLVEIDGVSISFEENDIIFINKEQIHSVISFSNSLIYAMVFNYSFLDFKKSDFCQSSIMCNLKTGQLLFPSKISKDNEFYNEIHKNIVEIIELYFSSIVGRELKTKCNLYGIIFSCYKNKQFKNNEFNNNIIIPQLAYIKSTIKYMEENLSYKITINELATNINISSFYLIKLFKQFTKTTPIEYLTNLRLERSIELLIQEYPITQVAYDVGINNTSYFIRIFKKKYNKTPKAFSKSLSQ